MSDIHRPERKQTVNIRLTESHIRRLRALARAQDRSVSNLVARIVHAELDAIEAREASQ